MVERWLVGLGALGVLVFVGGSAVAKERELARSDTLLLDLRPRDPRSLVQGDYMGLRYRISDELESWTSGTVVVDVDEHGVATVDRLYWGGPLDTNEHLLQFHVDTRVSTPVARSFLFEEGRAEAFARARYAIIAVTPEGRATLVGLADQAFAPIGPARHLW